ncbi:MAG: peptidylprolyl isomerase [Xenococcaceae cyanobacterium MO_207.B15]|nr:peptidylprolyl isomerase [Xenococcaceae cyanobacterium MO_207.B15]
MINFLGISIESDEIVDFLKGEMLLKQICQKILYQKIIEKAAIERDLAISPEEIQTEADSIRYGKRLEKAADTLAWLEDQMVTTEEWEAGIRKRLLAQKLAEHLFEPEVESYFAQNKLDFDQFILYQIVVPYEQLAQEIYYQIEEEEISFYEAAHLYDMDERRRYHCGYEGKIGRWSLPPHLAEAIGNATPRQVVGPIATEQEQKYHLLMIEEFIPAELTPERHQDIINRLFKKWLESEFNSLVHNQ